MIHSHPKSSSVMGISLFLVGVLIATIWLFVELIKNPGSFLWMKLILAPTLLVIGIVVATKGYSTAITLTMGNNKLTYRYLIGPVRRHKITDIAGWNEEVVARKSDKYRRLSIHLNSGKILRLSNHENSEYQSVVNYLMKKVKNRM